VTAIGAGLVFFTSRVSRKFLTGMEGFAAGVMLAATYWSLLAPALVLAGDQLRFQWMPAAVGLFSGAIALCAVNRILPHLHRGHALEKAQGLPSSWNRQVLLMLAITLHNIPEGLAVGVAFGAASIGLADATFGSVLALTLGIGLQNTPEGLAISLPMRREGFSPWRSFLFGQASALVEPLAAIIGAVAVLTMKPVLPYVLGFAAGAMLFCGD
jgi:zinc transporter, ZIP family